jgi:hypothetical protein
LESLGGRLAGAPTALSWGPDRLDVFAVGADQTPWWWRWNGAWSAPQQLPVGTHDLPSESLAATFTTTPRTLHVFAAGATLNTPWHWWGDGISFQGPELLVPAVANLPAEGIAAVSAGPQRLDVFAAGSGNRLWHWWKKGLGVWQVVDHGGGRVPAENVSAVSRGAGLIDVFALYDQRVWWWEGKVAAAGPGVWAGPVALPLPKRRSNPLPDRASVTAISMGTPATVHVFAVGDGNTPWHWSRAGAGDWTDPEQLPPGASLPGNEGIAAVSPSTGNLDVYSGGGGNHLWHWSRDASGLWTDPVSLGGDLPEGGLSAASRKLNRVDVFALGKNGTLQHWPDGEAPMMMTETDPIRPLPDELCTGEKPAELIEFQAPARFVEAKNEGRLVPQLRTAAQMARDGGTIGVLLQAALAFFGAAHPSAKVRSQPDGFAFCNALADLTVTGRMAYDNFAALHLSLQPLIAGILRSSIAPLGGTAVHANEASLAALERAYRVAWALRGPPAVRAQLRWQLGWIAVSGEDDSPHRPVNVVSAEFPQYEIPVTVDLPPTAMKVGKVTLQARFFIASLTDPTPQDQQQYQFGQLPKDLAPIVPKGDSVILFLHGDSSSAEEALGLLKPSSLLRAGHRVGVPLSIVSVDLPNCGYSSRFDHTAVADSIATTYSADPFHWAPNNTPILDFVEEFVVAFVEALHSKTAIKDRIVGVVGGSLGGSLGLRLGRRERTKWPWVGNIVSWSPASVWTPNAGDLIKAMAPNSLRPEWDLGPPSLPAAPEPNDLRAAFFAKVFDAPLIKYSLDEGLPIGAVIGGALIGPLGAPLLGLVIGGAFGLLVGPPFLPAQPFTWYRRDWPCRQNLVDESRASQQEVYDQSFRRWHWRLCAEQLVFSHVDSQNHRPGRPAVYLSNWARTLLMAAADDNYKGANIYDATRKLASWMVNTPGRSIFLLDTGHSIPAERPWFMTKEIAHFLLTEAGLGTAPA